MHQCDGKFVHPWMIVSTCSSAGTLSSQRCCCEEASRMSHWRSTDEHGVHQIEGFGFPLLSRASVWIANAILASFIEESSLHSEFSLLKLFLGFSIQFSGGQGVEGFCDNFDMLFWDLCWIWSSDFLRWRLFLFLGHCGPSRMSSMARMTKYLKPYELKLHFSNKYVRSQVVHKPTSRTVAAATTQEKEFRNEFASTCDVAAAAKIAGVLAERLKLQEVPAVAFELKKGERYHGKIKAFIDSLREHGVLLV